MKQWTYAHNLQVLLANWGKNHRHHGGIRAAMRCVKGTSRLSTGLSAFKNGHSTGRGGVDVITFSVVPRLSETWAVFMERALPDSDLRILIGDCSGGLVREQRTRKTSVMPLLNFAHGEKLDLFFEKLCGAEYVVVCDDDVFWLDDRALKWALERFAEDPKLAVVSLRPRAAGWPPVAKRTNGVPMGSYCLVIRRELWIREKLSFQIVDDVEFAKEGFYFDTADFANVQLLESGYSVLIAPEEIRSSLISFDGTSCWALRIQQHRGEIKSQVAEKPALQVKVYLSILVLREMAALAKDLTGNGGETDLVPRESLDTAQRILEGLMEKPAKHQAQEEVGGWFRALNQARKRWPNCGEDQ